MTTPRITGPVHPLVAAYRNAQRDHQSILAKHKRTAAELLAHHEEHGDSSESVYEITSEREDGPAPYDEVLRWRYVGPREHHGDLADRDGYLTIRTSDLRRSQPINDEGLKWGAHIHAVISRIYPAMNDDTRYRTLIKAAYTAAPQIGLMLTVGAASGAIEWDTGETIHQAALRIALDAAWSIRGESGYWHTPERVVEAMRSVYGQTRPIRDYADNFLAHRESILADLQRMEVPLGGEPMGTREVAERAGIDASTLRGYVTRQKAPAADVDRDTRNPRWHGVTVVAWLATR